MLDISNTRIQLSMELVLSDYTASVEEGMALEFTMENGYNKVKAAAGTSGAVFAGAALSYYTQPVTTVQVDVLTISSTTNTVTLSQTPTGQSVFNVLLNPTLYNGQYYGGTQLTEITTGNPTSTQYLVGASPYTTLTFNAANAGAIVIVTYTYPTTVQEAITIVGDGVAGRTVPSDSTGTIGVIQRGLVFTSNFDTTTNWAASTPPSIYTANGGIFTGTSGGATVDASVYFVPSADTPFLGLLLNK